MKIFYTLLFAVILAGCAKENIMPVSPKLTPQQNEKVYSDTDTSNPEYWYNGTTGTALVRVVCMDCTAIANFGSDYIPFMFNADGVGYLKYTPKTGMQVYIAVCPRGTKAIKADILDSKNVSLFSYSGTNTANWINTFVIK